MITVEFFKKIFPKADIAYVNELNEHLPKYKVEGKLRVCAFLAQTGIESCLYTHTVENLNYSAERLKVIFPKYFKTRDVTQYARQPQKIANVVYGGRLGNGDESTGDGFKYRGRGLIQLTGKTNYKKFADFIGDAEIMSNPDLVAQPKYALLSALWYWTACNLNRYADAEDLKGMTKAINGGYNGLQERIDLYNRIKRAM